MFSHSSSVLGVKFYFGKRALMDDFHFRFVEGLVF